MFLGYVAATTIGLVLLLASLVMGHGGAHDLAASADGAGGGAGHEAGEASVALQVLSLRFWIYFLAFGGLTGLLLRWLAGVGEPLAALIAAGVGIGCAVASRLIMRRIAGGQASGMVTPGDFVGRSAAVVVPFAKGATGKVRVRVRDAEIDLLAHTDDGEALGASDEVLIVEVREGSALVTRAGETRR